MGAWLAILSSESPVERRYSGFSVVEGGDSWSVRGSGRKKIGGEDGVGGRRNGAWMVVLTLRLRDWARLLAFVGVMVTGEELVIGDERAGTVCVDIFGSVWKGEIR